MPAYYSSSSLVWISSATNSLGPGPVGAALFPQRGKTWVSALISPPHTPKRYPSTDSHPLFSLLNRALPYSHSAGCDRQDPGGASASSRPPKKTRENAMKKRPKMRRAGVNLRVGYDRIWAEITGKTVFFARGPGQSGQLLRRCARLLRQTGICYNFAFRF